MPSPPDLPRFYLAGLNQDAAGQLDLPPETARHVQVRRLQPGDAITLFDGQGGQWQARVRHMGRRDVRVELGERVTLDREADRPVHLAVAVMASERMDWLLEKATELGMHSLTPILSERGNTRLEGVRAEKKRQRWQAVAIAACEQCGRNRLPQIHAPIRLPDFLAQAQSGHKWLLSLQAGAMPMRQELASLGAQDAVTLLSGPEGGLSPEEEAQALAAGYQPLSLGPRTLRAETAPLAALAALSLA